MSPFPQLGQAQEDIADDGFLYVLDGHPFFMIWDEDELPNLVVKYPYFIKTADQDE